MLLRTPRLRLQVATPELARADLAGREELARALGVEIPAHWPPELYDQPAIEYSLARLEQGGSAEWTYYYMIREDLGAAGPIAAGIIGYKGPPSSDGSVEVGYSVLPSHRRIGLATEGVAALVDWAFGNPAVNRVLAETLPALLPSIGVLEKGGFRLIGPGSEPGVIRFELNRADHEAGRTWTPPHLRTLLRLFYHMHWADEQAHTALLRRPEPDPDAWRLYGHILSAESLWLSRLRGEPAPLPVWPDLDPSDAQALSQYLREDLRAFLWRQSAEDLGRLIGYRNSAGDDYESTTEDILLHLCLHGSYHRGQIAHRLREAGAVPAPSDYIAFVRGAPAATAPPAPPGR